MSSLLFFYVFKEYVNEFNRNKEKYQQDMEKYDNGTFVAEKRVKKKYIRSRKPPATVEQKSNFEQSEENKTTGGVKPIKRKQKADIGEDLYSLVNVIIK